MTVAYIVILILFLLLILIVPVSIFIIEENRREEKEQERLNRELREDKEFWLRLTGKIIFCKDCKHNYNTCFNHGMNEPICDFTDRKLKETDFCSFGERKAEQ